MQFYIFRNNYLFPISRVFNLQKREKSIALYLYIYIKKTNTKNERKCALKLVSIYKISTRFILIKFKIKT